MHHKTVAAAIVATYSALFGIWAITRPAAVQAFSHQPVLPADKALAVGPPDRFRVPRTVGVLWVFLANIGTIGLFVGSILSPTLAARLPRLRLELPRIVNLAGAGLFVLNGAWCTLALIYNPGYRPFFLKPKGAARLATRGPYALVRHPRYAGEAAFNVILAAFTGAWLPLLGILGWPALRKQAELEEEWLLSAAPEAYGEYRQQTRRFVPAVGRSPASVRDALGAPDHPAEPRVLLGLWSPGGCLATLQPGSTHDRRAGRRDRAVSRGLYPRWPGRTRIACIQEPVALARQQRRKRSWPDDD